MADDDGLLDFINAVQSQEEEQKKAESNPGVIDRIRRASSAGGPKGGKANDGDEIRLSQIGTNPTNDVNQFAQTINNMDSRLSAVQKRHFQAEYLWGYEANRRAKAEAMGEEVMTLGRNFAKRVDTGIFELEALSGYLKARGAAERAYADAVRKSAEKLNAAGDDCRTLFQDLDVNVLVPKVLEFASTLDESLPEDVSALLEEFNAFANKARPRIGKLHTYFLKSERVVRDQHSALVKSFNNMLVLLRTNATGLVSDTSTTPKSTLDPNNDPWLVEQTYRGAVQAANRHSERYIHELGQLEDELIVLGQKRAVVIMCAKKIVLFETVKLHTECSHKLEVISKSVSGDKELLDGHKTVEDTPSDMSDNVNYEVPVSLNSPDASDIRTSSEGAEDRGGEDNHPEDSVVAKECKYTFQMPLPPSGTHAYEEDLSFTMREVPPEESSTGLGGEFLAKELRKTAVEELCADSSKWQTVRAVLTSERILHLYSNEPAETNRGSTVSDSGAVKGGEGRHYGGSITQLPMKSINCRRVGSCVEGVSGGGEGASIRRSYYAGQEDEEEEEEEEDDSPAARCFEIISKQNTSLMKSFNLFGSNKSKSTSDHFLFQAQDKRALEIWLKILRDDSVNLGDPIAIATCVDTPHYSDEEEEGADDGDYDEDDRDSVSAQAIEQLLKLAELPEIEEVRTSIFRAASDIDDEEGGVDYGEDDDNDNGTGGSEN